MAKLINHAIIEIKDKYDNPKDQSVYQLFKEKKKYIILRSKSFFTTPDMSSLVLKPVIFENITNLEMIPFVKSLCSRFKIKFSDSFKITDDESQLEIPYNV